MYLFFYEKIINAIYYIYYYNQKKKKKKMKIKNIKKKNFL